MAEISAGNLYDMNKILVGQGHVLTGKVLQNKIDTDLYNYFESKRGERYFMLLCHEQRNYTIFHVNDYLSKRVICNELIESLLNRGAIYAIDITPDKYALEIWLKMDEELCCYYFFPYSNAVVEV